MNVTWMLLLLPLSLACASHVRPSHTAAHDGAIPPAVEVHSPTRAPVGVTSRILVGADHDRKLATTIWYPAINGTIENGIWWDGIFPGRGAWNVPFRPAPQRLPLVLLSHGSGGDGTNLAWLAEALASRGYVAAAVDHPGDRFGDSSTMGRLAAWRRPPDISAVLTQLLADPVLGPRLDPRRVVVAGHSSGALTGLLLVGARLQPRTYFDYCHARGAGPDCTLFDGVDLTLIPDLDDAGNDFRDRRIRAVVALAPVLGPGVTRASLRRIDVPVIIVASRTDELVPFERNAARYHRLIPRSRLVVIPNAGHFVFMPVCNEPGRLIVPQVCVDRTPAVDRSAVHQRTAALTIAAFDRVLGIGRPR